jgi:hypothetical protein
MDAGTAREKEKKAPPARYGDGGAGTAGTKRVFEALSNV